MPNLNQLKKELKKLGQPECKKILQKYFKTGKGEYGEGDIFLGVKIWPLRTLAKEYDLSLNDITKLLKSKIHEYRMVAILMLVKKFGQADQKTKKQIFNLYLKNTKYINNWDLIDLSTPNIIGAYLLDKKRDILYRLAKSKSIWEKRIAMLATLTFIKNNQFKDTLKISKILLNDDHDLIHKAVGWMLREVGKRNIRIEEEFLKKYYKIMPRTMLRYAIEKFPEKKRQKYLKK